MAEGDLAYSHVPSDGGALLCDASGNLLHFADWRYWRASAHVSLRIAEEPEYATDADAAENAADLAERMHEYYGWRITGVGTRSIHATFEDLVPNHARHNRTQGRPWDFLEGDTYSGKVAIGFSLSASSTSLVVPIYGVMRLLYTSAPQEGRGAIAGVSASSVHGHSRVSGEGLSPWFWYFYFGWTGDARLDVVPLPHSPLCTHGRIEI